MPVKETNSANGASTLAGLPHMPLEKVYVFWFAGGSCDGCSISVLGATNPPLEQLMAGRVPGLPQLLLSHTALSYESGDDYVRRFQLAERGELDGPFVVCLEGSVPGEEHAGEGYWSAVGEEDGRQIPVAEWLQRLTPKAAATIAVGTCATWGGIPAAKNGPTHATGLMDFLGKDYRSAFGLPVVNIPGCAPIGDNFIEVVAGLLLFLQGLAPLPEFDDLGRPAWLFGKTAHLNCNRAGYYEEGVFAQSYGDPECLVELGCWGPVVQCNVPSRGWINGVGGCTQSGGICIGCTMPGFPDKFSPIYMQAAGAFVSTAVTKLYGPGIRAIRKITQQEKNRSIRWDKVPPPSGWARNEEAPKAGERAFQGFYKRLQNMSRTTHVK